jgi:RNA recognition motif-containing protein
MSSSKLFVGGLSWDTSDQSLEAAFAQHGTVTEAKVILDRDTGRSRGFGFVTFADAQSARNAQTALDGSNLDGRSIKVNEAQERSGRGGGNRGGGGHGGDNNNW